MAIVDMSSFSLFAFASDRSKLLHKLQEFEYVHLMTLEDQDFLEEMELKTGDVPESIVAINEDITKVEYSIDILSKYDERESGLKALKNGPETLSFEELEDKASNFDFLEVYNKLRDLDRRKEENNLQISRIKTSIQEIEPWIKLATPISEIKNLDKSISMMGTIPKRLYSKFEKDLLDLNNTYVEALSENKDNTFILILTHGSEEEELREILRLNSFMSINLPIENIPEEEIALLNNKMRELQEENKRIDEDLIPLANSLPEIEIVYDYLLNRKLRVAASENFLMTDHIDVIQGFIPSHMVEKFQVTINKVLDKNSHYMEIQEADRDDPNVPILLKNNKFAKSFESLTNMYSLPQYNEIDPTPLFAPFYLFFFGMMVADVGYGLVTLIGTFVALKFFNLNEERKDFVRFFYYLSYSIIFWGLIYGSFFALSIPTGLINPSEQYNEVLIVSIIFGAIHIYYALAIKAYMHIREGKYLDALYDTGFWYMALTGGIVLILSMVAPLPTMLVTIFKYVMIVGMVGIVLTGGRDAASIGGRLGSGLYELYGISGYVGDFVSYSRLMALGLSGGFIASAINQMVGMLFDIGIFGIVAGIVIFVGGQFFNIFLSLLSAYVHTIRLTYVEFFGKFYDGGGKVFKTLRSKPKYIDIK